VVVSSRATFYAHAISFRQQNVGRKRWKTIVHCGGGGGRWYSVCNVPQSSVNRYQRDAFFVLPFSEIQQQILSFVPAAHTETANAWIFSWLSSNTLFSSSWNEKSLCELYEFLCSFIYIANFGCLDCLYGCEQMCSNSRSSLSVNNRQD
jgi:hypothetical protein